MSNRFVRRAARLLLVTCVAALPVAAARGDASPEVAKAWKRQVIYLVMTDRFFNGDSSNDAAGDPAATDRGDVDRFHGGDLRGVRQKLDYLKDLGVTAVWVTPVYKQVPPINHGGNRSAGYHGYWADFTFPDDQKMEPKLGADQDFTDLIAAAHGAEMKVVLDMVVNHAGYDAKLLAQRPQFFRPEGERDDERVWLSGLPDLAQEKPEVAAYLSEQSKGWVQRFPFDAIRMDTVKHVSMDYFKDSWFPAVRGARADLFVVGEALFDAEGDNPRDLFPRYFEAGFDSVFNFPVRRGMVETFAKGRSTAILAERVKQTWDMGRERALMMTNLVDNHDVPRFTNEPGPGVNEDEIARRYHMALTALFTLPGIPQLYYGNEIGMYGPHDHEGRRDMPEWAFTEAGRLLPRNQRDPGDPKLAIEKPDATFRHVKKLIALRKAHAALSDGDYHELWRQNNPGEADVYAFLRVKDDDRMVVVFSNGTLPSGDLSIPLPPAAGAPAGPLTDLLGGAAPAAVEGGNLKVNLPAKSFGVYKLP